MLEIQLNTLNFLVHHMSVLLAMQDNNTSHNFNLDNRAVLRFGVHKKDFMATKVCNFTVFFFFTVVDPNSTRICWNSKMQRLH